MDERVKLFELYLNSNGNGTHNNGSSNGSFENGLKDIIKDLLVKNHAQQNGNSGDNGDLINLLILEKLSELGSKFESLQKTDGGKKSETDNSLLEKLIEFMLFNQLKGSGSEKAKNGSFESLYSKLSEKKDGKKSEDQSVESLMDKLVDAVQKDPKINKHFITNKDKSIWFDKMPYRIKIEYVDGSIPGKTGSSSSETTNITDIAKLQDKLKRDKLSRAEELLRNGINAEIKGNFQNAMYYYRNCGNYMKQNGIEGDIYEYWQESYNRCMLAIQNLKKNKKKTSFIDKLTGKNRKKGSQHSDIILQY